jgi:F-type H+-transporting ATPase subunit delta
MGRFISDSLRPKFSIKTGRRDVALGAIRNAADIGLKMSRLHGCGIGNCLLETRKINGRLAPVPAPRSACAYREIGVAAGKDSGRDDVSEPVSISLGIASRYAQALFELAKEDGGLKALEADTEALVAALALSPEFGAMIASPMVAREDQAAATAAIAKKMGLSGLMSNTLALMANKRRLFVLPQLLVNLRARIAEEKGEVTAEVTAAAALSDAQSKKLAATLKASAGRDVKLHTTVDESLIGGLIVKLGSTMIDTSIKSKLAALQNAMKEVG